MSDRAMAISITLIVTLSFGGMYIFHTFFKCDSVHRENRITCEKSARLSDCSVQSVEVCESWEQR